ncbi:Sec-independent protein translocase protein TatB [uncultured Pseudoteredinibacter sp.]|uniref:Sec-independent protein translocase protein TatB n=1 Tax=uncultured Pseudoteredinibacter sp. TaxID=1641701 RepID=UPI002620B1E6|nr:Sec-independent protein translocase protein TatB [uncultured Pseudoteredinibacter sp.]
MFDIGFFELLLIAVVGLVVIGPERLPGTLRKLALYWGRIKRSISDTRQEIEQQIGADDIRRQLHNEEVMERLAKAEAELNKSLDIEEPNKTSEQSAVIGSDEAKPESSSELNSEPQAAAEKPQPTSDKTAS